MPDHPLNPCDVRYFLDEHLVEHVDDTAELRRVLTKLWHTVCTDRRITVSETGAFQTEFRNECVLLCGIYQNVIRGNSPPIYDTRFGETVLARTGLPLGTQEGREYTRQCETHVHCKHVKSTCAKIPKYHEVYDLMLGRIMAGMAYNFALMHHRRQTVTAYDSAIAKNLHCVMTAVASRDRWASTRDGFLYWSIMSHLDAERQAMLVWTEAPLRVLPKQYPAEQASDYVTPYLDPIPSAIDTEIEWETDMTPDSFVFAIAVCKEAISNNGINIYWNTTISHCVDHGFYIISRNFGPTEIGHVRKTDAGTWMRTTVQPGTKWPIATILLDYITLRAELEGDEAAATYGRLLARCRNPGRCDATNEFLGEDD